MSATRREALGLLAATGLAATTAAEAAEAALAGAQGAATSDWRPLFNGRNLDGWEVIGDGQWTVLAGGIIAIHSGRKPERPR